MLLALFLTVGMTIIAAIEMSYDYSKRKKERKTREAATRKRQNSSQDYYDDLD